jgi:hypothetical protein
MMCAVALAAAAVGRWQQHSSWGCVRLGWMCQMAAHGSNDLHVCLTGGETCFLLSALLLHGDNV